MTFVTKEKSSGAAREKSSSGTHIGAVNLELEAAKMIKAEGLEDGAFGLWLIYVQTMFGDTQVVNVKGVLGGCESPKMIAISVNAYTVYIIVTKTEGGSWFR
jgi:hypothetical protein